MREKTIKLGWSVYSATGGAMCAFSPLQATNHNSTKLPNVKSKLLLLFMLLVVNTIEAQNVPSYVSTNGLVGWWPFDGNTNELSGNGNNGIVNDTILTTDRYGVEDSAKSTTDLSKIKIDCNECKEIVYLFHSAFKKGISINSFDFFPMKALVENCYNNKRKECGSDVAKQLDLLSGNMDGGPTSYGDDSKWRIPSTSNFHKLKISKNDAINNFKKSYSENLITDCSECTEVVDKFYNTFTQKTILNEAEFKLLKSKVQDCKNQKSSDCGDKMEKQLKLLSGNLEGGPSSYGDDSKWRLADKSWKLNYEIKLLSTLPSKDVIFSYKNRYGVQDKEGLVFIYPKYDNIEEIKFNNTSYFLVTKDKKQGIIDFSGNVKLQIEYNNIEYNRFNSNILLYRSDNNKRGVVFGDFLKNEIECESIFFAERFCVFSQDNQYGFVDEFGEIKIKPRYDKFLFIGERFNFKYFTNSDITFTSGGGSIDIYYIPSNEVLVVQKNNKFGLIGGTDLKEILPPNYEMIGHKNAITSQCIKGLIPIWENGKMGYITDKGIILITPKYQQILGFGMKGLGEGEISFVKKDNKWGLFSNKNLIELTPLQYDEISTTQYGYAQVKIGNKYGLIGIDGKELFKPQFDSIIDLKTNNGVLVVQNGGLYGLVKTNGNLFTPTIYQNIEINYGYWNAFQKSAWNVKLNNKIGIINDKGILIVQPKYQEIKDFVSGYGLASVKINGKYGMINGEGVEIIKPIYDYPLNFNDGKLQAIVNGKSIIINNDGSTFINNFSNSALSSLEFNRQSVSDALDKKFEKMYNDASGKIIYSSALGTKFNYQSFINNTTSEILKDIENSIGGQLTNIQLKEFYSIRATSEKRVTSYLAQLSGFLKSNPQLKNESIYGASNSSSNSASSKESNSTLNKSKLCSKCSREWTIFDYDEYNRKYLNERKETKYGFIPCSTCQGTKKMSVTAGSNYRGKGCTPCRNSGWMKCNMAGH